MIAKKLNLAFEEERLRLGVGALSLRFGFLSLKMSVLRLEFDKYKSFLVAHVKRLHTSKFGFGFGISVVICLAYSR